MIFFICSRCRRCYPSLALTLACFLRHGPPPVAQFHLAAHDVVFPAEDLVPKYRPSEQAIREWRN